MATLKFKMNNENVLTGNKELSSELIFSSLGLILESKKTNGKVRLIAQDSTSEEVNSSDIKEITIVF